MEPAIVDFEGAVTGKGLKARGIERKADFAEPVRSLADGHRNVHGSGIRVGLEAKIQGVNRGIRLAAISADAADGGDRQRRE